MGETGEKKKKKKNPYNNKKGCQLRAVEVRSRQEEGRDEIQRWREQHY